MWTWNAAQTPKFICICVHLVSEINWQFTSFPSDKEPATLNMSWVTEMVLHGQSDVCIGRAAVRVIWPLQKSGYSYFLSLEEQRRTVVKEVVKEVSLCLYRTSWPTDEVRSLHALILESLKLIFNHSTNFLLTNYSFGKSVRTSTLCMTHVIFPTIVDRLFHL